MKHISKLFHYLKTHKRIAAVALIILIVLGFVFRPQNKDEIETQAVKKQDLTQMLTATGSLDSTTTADLTFLAGGKLVYLGAKKGDFVESGQVIATLDGRTAEKNLQTALRNYALQRNEFDQTKDDYQNHTPQDALNIEMKRILENNQYDLEKAVISVELQQLAREQSVLVAPFTGIVTRADVRTAGINVGATTTFSIADPSSLVFKIDVDEADIGKVRPAQHLKVILNAYPERTFDLNVTSIDFSAHTTSTGGNAYTVEASFPDNSGLDYRIGMNGDAEIIIAEKKDVLTVSLASLTDDNSVYVKNKDTYVKRKITTGIQSDTEIEVTGGLKEGDMVALQPDDVTTMLKKKKGAFSFN